MENLTLDAIKDRLELVEDLIGDLLEEIHVQKLICKTKTYPALKDVKILTPKGSSIYLQSSKTPVNILKSKAKKQKIKNKPKKARR